MPEASAPPEPCELETIGLASHASVTTVGGTTTGAPAGDEHSVTGTVGQAKSGGVETLTVTTISSSALCPWPSSTRKVKWWLPRGSVTVGVEPSTTPPPSWKGPRHV